jgi:hypothetical protein
MKFSLVSLWAFASVAVAVIPKTPAQGLSTSSSSVASLSDELTKHEKTLVKVMRDNRLSPPKQAGSACPDTVLDGYLSGKFQSLHICPTAMVVWNLKAFDKSVDGEAAGMSFIHFLVLPNEHISAIWMVKSAATITEMDNCWREFLAQGGSKTLLTLEEGKVKSNTLGHQHFQELSQLVPTGGFHPADFETFFHGEFI